MTPGPELLGAYTDLSGMYRTTDPNLPLYVRCAAKCDRRDPPYVLVMGGCYQLMTETDVAEYRRNLQTLERG